MLAVDYSIALVQQQIKQINRSSYLCICSEDGGLIAIRTTFCTCKQRQSYSQIDTSSQVLKKAAQ